MSEELLQRDLLRNPEKIGTWNFYNIGATSINALKEAGILRNIDYGDVARKKVDALITKQKEVIAVIEHKSPNQFNTQSKKDSAIEQEFDVARKIGAKLIIATDTQETVWVNVLTGNNIKNEDGSDFNYLFNSKDQGLQKVIIKIIQSINDKNDKILPQELIAPTSLAKSIWQDIWSVSGATAENCLYTFVELFIFKYLSDLGVLQGFYSFNDLLNRYKTNDDNEVLEYYATAVRPEIKKKFPENPTDRTTIINGTIFVSKDQKAVSGYSTVFRKVLERFRDYGKLEHIDHDFKSKLFESFLKESISKKNWGQFFTPIKVVRAINEMAKSELKPNMIICDPACGVGKFPLEYIKDNINTLFEVKDGKIASKVKIVGFDKGFDKDEQKTIILAKANMLIYFSELILENQYTQEFATLFNESFILKTNSILGTLSEPIQEVYDLILTNPPYVTSGSSNLKEEITKDTVLRNYYKINGIGVEGLFMEWIIRALKPNGKAFIVVPDGIFNRQNDKNLRKFILEECFIDAIISLPVKTFFTTPKKTYVLAVTKKNNISEKQVDPVFTYLCSEIGESRDNNRFDIEQNDLQEAVSLFNAFKGSKEYITANNTDKRCKIQNIERFTNNIENHWIIDKDWSEQEKIELGVTVESELITAEEFSDLLSEVSDTIHEHSNAIKGSQLNTRYMPKKISSIFTISKGKGEYTKKFMNSHKGDYPVYSSQTFDDGIIANINTYDYDCECLTWTTDGTYVGTVFLRNGKFSMTTHCGALFLKEEYKDKILLSYLHCVLNNILPLHKEGERSNKRLGSKRISNIEIPIPIDDMGNIDIQGQQEIVERYNLLQEIKNNIAVYKEKIDKLNVVIEVNAGLKI
ncbi:MAG: N-6 DNA methylase [Spirochaetaceae bacterium]|nr:N-6 DNA methylase [Spirochaetaceae bacterium]